MINEMSTVVPLKNKRMSPSSVLNKYKPYLCNNGSIRSCEEAVWFSNMMPKVTHNIERCVLLYIIEATAIHAAPPITEKFLNNGGWIAIDSWFNYYLQEKNISFLTLILKILDRLPITIQRLRNVTIAKSLKAVSKLPDQKLKQSSKMLIKRWKALVFDSKNSVDTKHDSKKTKEQDGPLATGSSTKRIKSPEPDNYQLKKAKDEPSNSFIKSLDILDDIRKPFPIDDDFQASQSINDEMVMDSSNNFQDENDNNSFHSELMEEDYGTYEQDSISGAANIIETDNNDTKSTKKKSVSWKPDSELASIKYYEKSDIGSTLIDVENNVTSCNVYNDDDPLDSAIEEGPVWFQLVLFEHDADSPIKSFCGSSNEKVLQSKFEEQFIKTMNICGELETFDGKSPKEPEGADLGVGIKPRIPPHSTNHTLNAGSRALRPPYKPNNSRIPAPFSSATSVAVPPHPQIHHNTYHNYSTSNSNKRIDRPQNRYSTSRPDRTCYNSTRYDANSYYRPPIPNFEIPRHIDHNVVHHNPYMDAQPPHYVMNYPRPHLPIDDRSLPPQPPQSFNEPNLTNRPTRFPQPNIHAAHTRCAPNVHSNENYNHVYDQRPGDIPLSKIRHPYSSHSLQNKTKQEFIPRLSSGKTNHNPHVKTIKCRVHSSGGKCRFGDNCRFIHDDPI